MPIKHKIRKNGKQKTRVVQLTPLKAIKLQCVECMGYQPSLVANCDDTLCVLYPFRLGRKMSTDNR